VLGYGAIPTERIADGLHPASAARRGDKELTGGLCRRRLHGRLRLARSEHGVYVRLDADRFFTYSRSPEEFPS
jgi:hypothetical protein